MLRNFIKIAIRYLIRNPVYALINVSGLSVGITCALLILLFVRNEFSFDDFQEKRDQLYRLVFEFSSKEGEVRSPQMTAPVGPDMVLEFPEVICATRFTQPEEGYISYQGSSFSVEGLMYTDSTFFRMFSFPLLTGDPDRALAAPYSIVLDENVAAGIFGQEDPIGKVIRWNNRDDLTVTGVAKASPANSHIRFGSLISLSSRYRDSRYYMDWNGGMQYYHYLELSPGTDPEELVKKFPDFMYRHINYLYEQAGTTITATLQPMKDIHLHSDYVGDMGPTGSMGTIYIYGSIAIFILFIACINFMNLTTAMATQRAREVGMRKVFGAGRPSLIRQFLGESVVLSGVGLVLALILVEILLPSYEQVVQRELDLYRWDNLDLLLGIPVLVFGVGLLAGWFPAVYLSAFRSVAVLKGVFRGMKGYAGLRNGLVFFQFAISIVLIICTLVIYLQLGYIRSLDTGYRKDDLMVLSLTSDAFKRQYETVKARLAELPDVVSTTATTEVPGEGFSSNGYRPEGFDRWIMFNAVDVDFDYVRTLGLQVLRGRSFSADFPTDREAYMINEALARQLDWEDPVGKTLFRGGSHTIIGVVKDFQFASVHQEIGPLVFAMEPYPGYGYLLVRFNTSNLPRLIAQIAEIWKETDPNEPFEYSFMDQVFDRVYRSEKQMSRIMLYVAVLAILIACMGLFGLALYSTEQRTREIGIRKVFGSTVSEVIRFLTGRFTRYVVLANLLAWPVAYWIVRRYMQMYAYRIDFPVWIFLVTAFGVYLLALLTVACQSYRAGSANPGDSLRHE